MNLKKLSVLGCSIFLSFSCYAGYERESSVLNNKYEDDKFQTYTMTYKYTPFMSYTLFNFKFKSTNIPNELKNQEFLYSDIEGNYNVVQINGEPSEYTKILKKLNIYPSKVITGDCYYEGTAEVSSPVITIKKLLNGKKFEMDGELLHPNDIYFTADGITPKKITYSCYSQR